LALTWIKKKNPKKITEYIIREKTLETAKYANHAKTQWIEEESVFAQREKAFIRLTPSSLAYLAYFAVGTGGSLIFRLEVGIRWIAVGISPPQSPNATQSNLPGVFVPWVVTPRLQGASLKPAPSNIGAIYVAGC
jgi:hypothetical protein